MGYCHFLSRSLFYCCVTPQLSERSPYPGFCRDSFSGCTLRSCELDPILHSYKRVNEESDATPSILIEPRQCASDDAKKRGAIRFIGSPLSLFFTSTLAEAKVDYQPIAICRRRMRSSSCRCHQYSELRTSSRPQPGTRRRCRSPAAMRRASGGLPWHRPDDPRQSVRRSD
jgi:hypothetical protein